MPLYARKDAMLVARNKDELSGRQKDIMEFIKRETKHHGYPPSVREIGDAVGLRSSSTVHGHLSKLEKLGLIRRDPTKPRAIEILDPSFYQDSIYDLLAAQQRMETNLVSVPVVGRVAAGRPILATENVEDYFPLPKSFAHGNDAFMLRVKGDSMVEAGILNGDYVVVKPQRVADDGDIVVALIGDEATVKRFFREKETIRLQPENRLMEPIYARDVQVVGRVVGVLRQLQ